MKAAWKKWDQFWFGSQDLQALSLFRIAIGTIYFFYIVSRTPDVLLLYTNSGFLPSSYREFVTYFTYQYSIFYWIDSEKLVIVCHYLLLASLLTLTLGFCTRLSAILVYFLHLMFISRNPAAQYGVDFVGTFYLFYLMFAKSNAWYSLDALCLEKRGSKKIENLRKSDLFSTVAIRLMQIQLCVIYFYSGICKMKGIRWWNGSAIWDVFTMEGLVRWDLSFIAWFPDVLVGLCYLTLLWETYFPVLIWLKPFRWPLIIAGLLMHAGFGVFINIPIFGALMSAIYILFFKKEEINYLYQRIIRTFSSLKS